MKPRVFLLLTVTLFIDASAFGVTRWVGPATYSGDVLRPQGYIDAVAPLYLVNNDFESLAPGSAVAMQNFGNYTLTNSPYAQTYIIAESSPVAGALPTSGSMALHLTSAPNQPTSLIVETSEPVISVGFALMGLESASWLYVYGGPAGDQLLGQYSIASSIAGVRRWIGLAETSRVITKIKLSPTQPEDYAIDDLEIAVHAPRAVDVDGLVRRIVPLASQSSFMQRKIKIGLRLLGCVGILICVQPVMDMLRVEIAARRLSSKQPAVREKSLRVLGEERDASAAPAVFKLLEQENDRDLLEKVGYTAMRLRDPQAVPILQRRADSGPDDPTRARLIIYAARVSNRDARLIDWLNAGMASPEHWRRAASALGLLELGRIEGGLDLVKMAPALDPGIAAWAFKEFRSFAEPMAQIVGYKFEAWKEDAAPPDGLLNQIKQFWEQYASPSLLADVLIRRDRLDNRWFQLNRLLHAQDKATNWLFSKK